MRIGSRHTLIVGTLAIAAFVIGEMRPVVRAAEGDEVEYTFDRPITDGEQTYA